MVCRSLMRPAVQKVSNTYDYKGRRRRPLRVLPVLFRNSYGALLGADELAIDALMATFRKAAS